MCKYRITNDNLCDIILWNSGNKSPPLSNILEDCFKHKAYIQPRNEHKWKRMLKTSETRYIQVSKYLCIHNTINAVPFYYLWYGAINNSIPTKHKHWENIFMCERAGLASLEKKFAFHILKLLFPSIFCWYYNSDKKYLWNKHFQVSIYIWMHIQWM